MRELLGHIVDGVVPDKILKSRNKEKSWSYGYNDQYNVVIISKDGTLGTIYEMNGLNIGLPEVPKDDTKILNYDKPEYDQKWERKPLPKGCTENTVDDYADYILEEIRRRNEGVFIYINGEVEYFPGCFYFFLNWMNLGKMYPHFRYTQKDLMLFWEACYADERCYGICYVKNRRLGWTTMQSSECLNRGTLARDSMIGIISKTGKDAKSMFRKTVNSFKKLPFFFKPQTDGTTNPKTELNFTKPAKRITRNFKRDDEEDDGLDTVIAWYNTDLNSMDSEKISPIQVIDEPGKWPTQVPFSNYWDVAKSCLEEGLEIVGKSMCGSTVNSMDKGGKEFKSVWDDSDLLERTENDQTKSGLYRIFIPAEYNLRGFYDEFGYPIIEDPETPIRNNEGRLMKFGAKTYLKNKRDSLKEQPEKLSEELRKYPSTITHAFRSAVLDCAFNLEKLFEQIDYNDEELAGNTIKRGDFVWEDGIQNTKVKWIPNPTSGKFWVTWMPPKELQNNVKDTGYGFEPLNGHLGRFGCDPYNRGKTADGRGSDGAIHGKTMYNTMGIPDNFYFLEYIERPPKVEIFFEDYIKVCWFYGMPGLIELSNEDFLKTLKRRGLRKFSMNRPDKKFADLTPTEKELGGISPQGDKIGNAQFYAIETFIQDHVGRATEKDISKQNRPHGEMGKMFYNRTLEQWKDVDPNKRTDYDAYISSSLAEIATQKIQIKSNNTREVKVPSPFSKYELSA
ncbi:hypothetical protein [Galbibacter sp. BG1]